MNGSTAYSLTTSPPVGDAAIACIELFDDIETALQALGIARVEVGACVLRSLAGVDTGLVARWSDRRATLMPHAGPAIVRRLLYVCEQAGFANLDEPKACLYAEAESELEAEMLAALSRAASPLAVDLLLDQPRRWNHRFPASRVHTPRDRVLARLIQPPLIVTAGMPNIGKSSLLNALAGRHVSLIHNTPGTTRDHVGSLLNLAGLVVRWVDTPGLCALPIDELDRQAQGLARSVIEAADVVLLCGDFDHPPIDLATPNALRIALRADIARPHWSHDLAVSSLTGEGIAELVAILQERLVPVAAREDPAPWRFWPDLAACAEPSRRS